MNYDFSKLGDDIRKQINDGMVSGMEETAKIMLTMGNSIESIKKATNLPEDKIIALKNDYDNQMKKYTQKQN